MIRTETPATINNVVDRFLSVCNAPAGRGMNQLSKIMSGKFLVPNNFYHARERMVQFSWFGVHHLSVQGIATHCFLRDRRNGMVAWNEREGENQVLNGTQ